MSELAQYREKLNLTQKELAEQSGISIRTIQRIESGEAPRGYTLKTLAKTLGVAEAELAGKSDAPNFNAQLLKYINLAALPCIILPPLNILLPLAIMYYKKEWSSAAKQIVSLQMIWLIAAAVAVLASAFIKKAFNENNGITVVALALSVLANLFIILRNAVAIDKKNTLAISLNFSLL